MSSGVGRRKEGSYGRIKGLSQLEVHRTPKNRLSMIG